MGGFFVLLRHNFTHTLWVASDIELDTLITLWIVGATSEVLVFGVECVEYGCVSGSADGDIASVDEFVGEAA